MTPASKLCLMNDLRVVEDAEVVRKSSKVVRERKETLSPRRADELEQ